MEAIKMPKKLSSRPGVTARVLKATSFMVGLTVAAVGPAVAHHSFAMFDRSKTVTSEGTVKAMEWTNPHSWIDIAAVGPDGATRQFGIEAPSPNILIRHGWKRADVKTGDKIQVTYNPMKDGTPGGVIISLRTADGRVMDGLPH
jgi:hypothetical protein